jgi:hypothetical protein
MAVGRAVLDRDQDGLGVLDDRSPQQGRDPASAAAADPPVQISAAWSMGIWKINLRPS